MFGQLMRTAIAVTASACEHLKRDRDFELSKHKPTECQSFAKDFSQRPLMLLSASS
jgi:hypothetical protein